MPKTWFYKSLGDHIWKPGSDGRSTPILRGSHTTGVCAKHHHVVGCLANFQCTNSTNTTKNKQLWPRKHLNKQPTVIVFAQTPVGSPRPHVYPFGHTFSLILSLNVYWLPNKEYFLKLIFVVLLFAGSIRFG